jgi:Cu/Ag efflux pump CusA
MLPAAIGLSSDGSFRRPMAIAIIGGPITSTVLTLIIVPAVFVLFDDFERHCLKFSGALLERAPSKAAAGD